jgi:simple sugar transport system permease protein
MTSFLAAAIVAATPLLFATVGELIMEKSGSLNLGVEGMMLMGAIAGFVGAAHSQNAGVALLTAFAAGAGGALIFAFLTVTLRANQVVTGLTLTIFGTGVTKFIGNAYMGQSVPGPVRTFFAKTDFPGLSDIPFIGDVFFKQDIFIYIGYAVVALTTIFLFKTKGGLNLRAVGENASAADATGINVTFVRYMACLVGGGLCGLGGGYLGIVYVPMWQVDVVNGRGWIAVALVIFSAWNPIKAFAGSLLFGALAILGFTLQLMEVSISQYLVDMFPYIAAIVVVIISTHRNMKEDLPPMNLSVPYFREDR